MAIPTRILVIGGSGFIGKTLVPYMTDHGCAVTVLNRGRKKMEGCTQLLADRNVETDMRAAALQAETFDAIIDTSAYTLVQSQLAWQYFSDKTNKWIHISSGAVYKDYATTIPHKEVDETGGAEIWGKYGSDKSMIDSFLYSQSGATKTIILRPPYIYGPHNDVDRETFVWSRAEKGFPIIVPDKDNTPMQFLHVEDLACCIYTCIKQDFLGNAIYNAASEEFISIRDWVSMLLEICLRKKDTKIIRNTSDQYPIRNYFPFRDSPIGLDIDKIKKELNWQAKFDLRSGFTQTYGTYTADDLAKYLKVSEEEKEITKTASE